MTEVLLDKSKNVFHIKVKTNQRSCFIKEYDTNRDEYLLFIKGKPKGGQANAEIISFFEKELSKKVKLIGSTSSKKIIYVL